MGIFYIPPTTTTTGPVSLAAGQVAQGLILNADGSLLTVPTADGPNILQSWDILSIALPFAVAGLFTTIGQGPTTASLMLTAQINGRTIWTSQNQVSLVAAGTTTAWGNGSAGEDLINPLELDPGQRFSFGYELSFNAATTQWFIFLAGIAANQSNPMGPPAVVIPQQAPIRFDVNYASQLGRR